MNRLVFVEDYEIMRELMPYLHMLGVKMRIQFIPDTEVRMVSFKMRKKYFNRMADFFTKRHPGKMSFLTVGH